MDQWIEDGAAWCDQEGRRRSGEVDFGSRWQVADGPEWPLYRVSWIRDTGELYAIEERLEGRRRLCVLGIITDRETVERLMDGWTEPDFHHIGPFCKGHAPITIGPVDIVWGLKR